MLVVEVHSLLTKLFKWPPSQFLQEPDYNYRAEVKKLIPQLEYLDEIPASQTALLPSKKMHEDWLIIKESIKEGGLAGGISWLGMSGFLPGFIFSGYDVWKRKMKSKMASSKPTFNYSKGTKDVVVLTWEMRKLEFSTVQI